MKKTYAIAGITGIVLLLTTIGVFAYMNNGYGMMGYRNSNMMNSYYQNQNPQNQSYQGMMQGYSYEDMDKMHDTVVASIQDPVLRNQMNQMHEVCTGNRDSS